jgi:N-acetyl-gamma-glutamyl-phosphate reductase
MNKYSTVRVGVAGVTGYTGVELMKRLARHPHVSIRLAMASAGSEARRLPALARIWDAPVEAVDVDRLVEQTDAVFLALPDAAAAELAPVLASRGTRVFDLSGRSGSATPSCDGRWYPHTPEIDTPLTYGLPERYRAALAGARLVACAGCYPTAALLALQPLVDAGPARGGIIIDAKSGISGAGKTPSERTHFLRDPRQHGGLRRLRPPPRRRDRAGARTVPVTFVPHLVPLDRGIFETIYARLRQGWTDADIGAALHAVYADAPFVRLTGADLPEIKHVVHTNFCDIGWRVDATGGQLVLVACLDNLVKGAAGQAIQNFNVAFGFDETRRTADEPDALREWP